MVDLLSQSTVLVNNSDRKLKWALDLSKGNQILDDGVFKFLRSGGVPFLGFGEGRVEGYLDAGETTVLNIVFCPGTVSTATATATTAEIFLLFLSLQYLYNVQSHVQSSTLPSTDRKTSFFKCTVKN